MDLELLHDRATPIWHEDPDGLVPTSATAVLYRPDGSVLQSPAVTLPSVSTTVAAGSTAEVLVVDSALGLRVGERLVVVSDGETWVVDPALIDGTSVHLLSALPSVPDVGSSVRALRMTASVTAPGSGELASGLRVEWRYSDATASGFASQEASVVWWLWQEPVSASQVAELLATVFQTKRSEEFCRSVAERVSTKVRNAVEQTGRRPFLFASPGAFSEVAQAALRWVLADSGIGLVGDLPALVRSYRYEFNDEMTKVVAGLKGYDSDNKGRLDAPRRNVVSIRTVR